MKGQVMELQNYKTLAKELIRYYQHLDEDEDELKHHIRAVLSSVECDLDINYGVVEPLVSDLYGTTN